MIINLKNRARNTAYFHYTNQNDCEPISNAWKKAKAYAGKDGFIASLPDLVYGVILLEDIESAMHAHLTANSEEAVGRTPAGKPVVVITHGGGVLADGKRLMRGERFFTDKLAYRLTDNEFASLLEGRIRRKHIPVFSYTEFRKEVDYPKSYSVILDYRKAKNTECGLQTVGKLMENPLYIARAEGVQRASELLEIMEQWRKALFPHSRAIFGNDHMFNMIDPSVPQTRFINYRLRYGFDGMTSTLNPGTFVASSPRPEKAEERLKRLEGLLE